MQEMGEQRGYGPKATAGATQCLIHYGSSATSQGWVLNKVLDESLSVDILVGLGCSSKMPNTNAAENMEVCDLCRESKPKETFKTHCHHIFCTRCVRDHVTSVVQSQLAVSSPSFEELLVQILCPHPSCKEEIRRGDLMDLLGPKVVKSYERWLVSVFDKLYRPSLGKESRIVCKNLSCDRDIPSVILAAKVPDLGLMEVRHALEVRGLQRKCLKQQCVRLLLGAVGIEEKELNKALWLCTTCDAAWCAACGVVIPVIKSRSERNRLHSHCDGHQRYEIYKSLIELEEACKVYTQGRYTHQERKSAKANNSSTVKTIWADGTGFGGDYIENKYLTENMQAAAKKSEFELDGRVEKQLGFLTGVLNGNSARDCGRVSSLTVATCALLGWENILSRLLRQLATNDSMLDISERSSLYLKMVSLLKAIQMHAELLPVLAGYSKQDTFADKDGSFNQSFLLTLNANVEAKEEDEESAYDRENTVIRKMENIYKQAKVMLQRIQNGAIEGGNNATDLDISLAKELCKCYEILEENVVKQGISVVDSTPEKTTLRIATRQRGKKLDPEEEDLKFKQLVALYKEKLRALQFKQMVMTDDKGDYKHHYRDHIMGKVANSSCIDKRGIHNQKRMLHLSKEIASLATTLPLEWESSIHLCVDEERLDVLRALIVGPQGTPYQNGLFLFDIYLPPDYPQVPPYVHFLTTGGGKVRFNPNLYDSGKICLSLLGTWSGPGWVPGKSTLLQVLVSIQSLIFVKDPYYNEPGFEQSKSPEAEKENLRHREHTLSLAVLAALRKPDPLFADIVREHFRHKREEVEQQCDHWVAATADGYARHRIANIAKDIKSELQTLCS